jgi:microsomal prostaglandin-E synthase 2
MISGIRRSKLLLSSNSPLLKLYQYNICPFCCKVKAFLDWKAIPYEAVDVNPLTKSEIAFSKDYRKVPISMSCIPQLFQQLLVLKDSEQVNDSSNILESVISDLTRSGALPNDFKDSTDTEVGKWLQFVDKELAILLFPNITRSMLESWEAFGYINEVPHFNPFQKLVLRVSGAMAMRLANGKIKKKYEISDEREALVKCVNTWVRDGLQSRKFNGGDTPNLADVAVYGCLKSIEKFTTFAWLLGDADKELLVWYNRMRQSIPKSSCVNRM